VGLFIILDLDRLFIFCRMLCLKTLENMNKLRKTEADGKQKNGSLFCSSYILIAICIQLYAVLSSLSMYLLLLGLGSEHTIVIAIA
jgi:hypothetical protein